jgi:hypothetical protein
MKQVAIDALSIYRLALLLLSACMSITLIVTFRYISELAPFEEGRQVSFRCIITKRSGQGEEYATNRQAGL